MTNDSTSLLLVDTNILVYSIDPREAEKQQRAIRLVRDLASARRGILSSQVLGEFFNTVVRLLPPLDRSQAERAVDDFCEAFPVLPLTVDTVRGAIEASGRFQMSYWDALIWATAKLNGIPTVLTEDIQTSGTIEGVSFVNPFVPGFDIASLS